MRAVPFVPQPLNLGGCTPLHIAAYFNHEGVIRVLLSRPKVQVDPRDATHVRPRCPLVRLPCSTPTPGATCSRPTNLQSERMASPAHSASFSASLWSSQSTPLHYAASRGHVTSMKLLIDYGASLEARDKDGLTAIDLGREYHAQLTEPRPRLIEEAVSCCFLSAA